MFDICSQHKKYLVHIAHAVDHQSYTWKVVSLSPVKGAVFVAKYICLLPLF